MSPLKRYVMHLGRRRYPDFIGCFGPIYYYEIGSLCFGFPAALEWGGFSPILIRAGLFSEVVRPHSIVRMCILGVVGGREGVFSHALDPILI